jgi:hypothetical protein
MARYDISIQKARLGYRVRYYRDPWHFAKSFWSLTEAGGLDKAKRLIAKDYEEHKRFKDRKKFKVTLND